MPKRILAAAFAVLLCGGVVRSAELPIAITHGINFYHQEEWEPGKLRRWMRNNGELKVENNGPPIRINLRFFAESFRIPRTLQVRMGGYLLLDVRIPTEPLYVLVKDMPVAPGEAVLTFSTTPGPDRVSQYIKSSDQRELSIAFGPFSAIDARAPEAQREEMAAFPNVEHASPQLSSTENAARNLRREGRLREARDAYQAALESGHVYPTTYIWAGLTLVALDDLEGARKVLLRGRQVEGLNVVAISVRQISGQTLDYIDRSEVLAHRDKDPARALRKQGEIYGAVALYRGVLKQNSRDLMSSYWLGFLTIIAERPREAKPLLETVARDLPDTADAALVGDLQWYVGGR